MTNFDARQGLTLGLGKSFSVRSPRQGGRCSGRRPKGRRCGRAHRQDDVSLRQKGWPNQCLVFGSKYRRIANLEIQVERYLLASREVTRIKAANKTVILAGRVASIGQSKSAADIATRFGGEVANIVRDTIQALERSWMIRTVLKPLPEPIRPQGLSQLEVFL